MDVAELGFEVNPVGINKGITALDKLDAAEERVGRTAQTSGGNIDKSYRSAAGGLNVASGAAGGLAAGFGNIKTAIGGLGVLALGKNALTMSSDFDAAMNNVQSKLLITTDAMRELRNQATELGSTTSFSASQAAEGMGFLAQAGLDATQIMGAMPNVLNLAAGASISLAESADIATNVMGGFGLEVEDLPRIMDLLAGASAKTNTSVQEMASAFVKSAPVASQFGVSVADAAAAVGIMADSGIKGERAGTVLLNMFTRLINPVGEGGKALDKYNITTKDLFTTLENGQPKFVGFGAMMDLLASKGIDTADAIKIFGQEAGPGMLKILEKGSGGFQEYADKIDITGAALLQANIKMQGLPGSIKAMASAWEGFNLALGAAGGSSVAIALIDGVTSALRFLSTDGIQFVTNSIASFKAAIRDFLNTGDGIGSLDAAMSGTNTTMASFATVLGPVISALRSVGSVLSPLLPLLAPMAGYLAAAATAAAAFKATAAGITLVGGALAAVAGVALSPVTVSIAAVAAGAALLKNNWAGISGWWSGMWDGLKSKAQTFVSWWQSTTLDEKIASIKTGAIDIARNAITSFTDYWTSTTLPEKLARIETAGVDLAERVVNGFFNLWDTTLRPIAPQIIVDSVDNARVKVADFFTWWRATPFLEKVVTIETAAIDAARSTVDSFRTRWEGSTFRAHAPEIVTTFIDSAFDTLDRLIDGWNNFRPGSKTLTLVSDSIVAAYDAAIGLADWWRSTNLREKSADITFHTLQAAWDLATGLYDWWRNASFDSISLEFEFEDVAAKVGDWLKDITGGITDGWKRFVANNPMVQEWVDGMTGDIGSQINKMKAMGADLGGALVDGLKAIGDYVFDLEFPTVDELLAKGRALIASVRDWWDNVSLFEIEISFPSIDNLRDSGSKALDWALGPWKDRGEIEQVAQILPDTIEQTIKDSQPQIERAATALPDAITDTITAGIPDVATASARIPAAIADEIDAGKLLVGQSMDDLITVATGMFTRRQMTREAAITGGYITAGLADGIQRNIVDVELASEQMADATIAAAEQTLGVQSPSVVFRAIGRWLGIGLGLGIRDGASDAEKEAALMAQSVSNAALDEINKQKQRFADGFGDLFRGATNIDDVLDNARRTVQTFLGNLAGDFARDEMKILIGLGDTSGAEGSARGFLNKMISMFSDGFAKIKALFTGGGGFMDGLISALKGGLSKLTSLFSGGGAGGAGGLSSALSGLTGSAGAANGAVGGLSASLSSAAGTTGAIGAMAAAGVGWWKAVGSIFGSYKQHASGFRISVEDGEIFGQSIDILKKKTITFRNKYKTILGDMDTETFNMLTNFFTGLDQSVTGALTDLGVDMQGTILDVFDFESRDILNEEQLSDYFEDSTRQAYQLAFDRLGPELQRIVGDGVELATAPVEDIAALFADLATTASTVVPMLQQMGIAIGDSFDAQIASAAGLADAMGGTANLTESLTSLMESTVPAYQQTQNQINALSADVLAFNSEIGFTGGTLVSTSASLAAYTATLDTNTAAGAIAQQQVEAFTSSVDGAGGAVSLSVIELNRYRDSLDLSTQAGRDSAAGLDDLVLSFGTVATTAQQSATQLNAVTIAINETATSAFRGNAAVNEYTTSMDAAISSIGDLVRGMGETSVAAITTVDGLRDFIAAQTEAANAGNIAVDAAQANIAAALQRVDVLRQLEALEAQQVLTLNTVADAARNLNLNFDATSPAAIAASGALVELMGGLDAFSTATSNYYNTFFDNTERAQLELATSAASVQAWTATLSAADQQAITNNDTFRAYVESLNLTTTAGQQAFAAAMEVSTAFNEVTTSGQTTTQIMDALPDHLQGAFNTMTTAATDTAAIIDQAGGQIIASETTTADTRLSTTVAANDAIVSNELLTADQRVANVTSANDAIINSEVLAGDARLSTAIAATSAILSNEVLSTDQRVATVTTGANQIATIDATTANQRAATVSQASADIIAIDQATGNAQITSAQNTAQQVDAAMANASTSFINGAAVAGQAAVAVGNELGNMAGRAMGEAASMNNGVVSEAHDMNTLSGSAAVSMSNSVVGAVRGMVAETQGQTGKWIGHIRGAFNIITNHFGALSNNTNGATNALRSLSGTLQSIANSARNAGSTLYNTARINGSFSTGLGRVPFDGFIAETHKDEMILPANVANFFRESGIPTTQPASPSPVAANASVYRQDVPDNRAVLEAIRRELEEIKSNNGAAAEVTERRLSDLTQRTAAQTKVLEEVEKDIDRLQRIPA